MNKTKKAFQGGCDHLCQMLLGSQMEGLTMEFGKMKVINGLDNLKFVKRVWTVTM